MNWIEELYAQHKVAIFDGIIISIILWIFVYVRTWIFNCIKYSKYSGKYISYLKQNLDKEQFRLTLKRHNNKFEVIGLSIPNNEKIKGEIEMSTSIKNYGTGYYYHIVEEQNKQYKFGFYELQLAANNYIFVH